MDEKMEDIRFRNLQRLKDKLIDSYLEEINFDVDVDLYNRLVEHFVLGDLDDIYESMYLEDKTEEERKQILEIVHKYQDICFYNKNPNLWVESIDGVNLKDYPFIIYRLLENFDFLIRLYTSTNEESLKILEDYDQSPYYKKNLSIIESVKRNFINEDVLLKVLEQITRKDSNYSIFTENEIRTLLYYAEGVIYHIGEKVELVDPLLLGFDIYSRMNSNSFLMINEVNSKDILTNFFFNEDGFDRVVEDIFMEYHNKS